jgi:hypothetical protein
MSMATPAPLVEPIQNPYQQVLLERYDDAIRRTQVCWIPAAFAAGTDVQLKDADGNWSPGWKILSVYGRPKARHTLLPQGKQTKSLRVICEAQAVA